jgi:predicted ATPase
MIQEITLKNFKSHKNTHLNLGSLTLICGQNGVGKSSLIQSLLLLRQTFQKNRLQEVLELNGDLYDIGTAQDVFYQFAQEDFIEIHINFGDSQQFKWNFQFNDIKSDTTFLEQSSFEGDFKNLATQSLFNNQFQYLSASRLAPQESYPKDDYEVERNRQISIEKGQGELVAHFLDHYGKDAVACEELLHPSEEYKDLGLQTTAWAREISQNVNVSVEKTGASFKIKYSFDVKNGLPTNNFEAKNVGFGLTYTLPIIVAILAAKKDSLILIENPEAHLHPYGQAKLIELICLAAQAGIQILLETHSDHIINGVLVQAKKFEMEQKGIDKENISLYYFDREEENHSSFVHHIEILEGGKIIYPPKGFFDQISKDRSFLMGF